MGWRDQHTPRGRSAEVEDSIQYLRRYLGEEQEEEENIEGSAQRRGMTSSRGKSDHKVATGVLPTSAVSGDWRTKGVSMGVATAPTRSTAITTTTTTTTVNNSLTGGNPSWGSASSTPRRRHSLGDRGNGSSGVSPGSDGDYVYGGSSLRNDRSSLRGEKYSSTRDRSARDMVSPVREPLRLRYGSSAQTPVGRPPLHQQRQQEQQRQKEEEEEEEEERQTGSLTRRGNMTGWREDDNNSLRREIRSTKDWERRSKDSHWTNRDNYGNRLREVYNDPYDNSSSNNQHRPRRYSSDKSTLDDYTEDEERQTFSANERVMTPRRGTENGISQRTNGHSSGKRTITTEGVTSISPRGGGNSNKNNNGNGMSMGDDGDIGSVSLTKQPNALKKKELTSLEKHDMSTYSSRDVFPYPIHDDNMRSIIFYLKNHYALEEEEYLRGIQTMTPEDVLGLIQCFYVDVYRTIRHARDVAGVGRAGFMDKDPDVDTVLISNNSPEMESHVHHRQQQQQGGRLETNSEMEERRELRRPPPEVPSTPPPAPTTTTTTTTTTTAAVNTNTNTRTMQSMKLPDAAHRSPPHYHVQPQSLSSPPHQHQQQQQYQQHQLRYPEGMPIDTMRPARTSSHSVHWDHTTSAPPTYEVANSSQHTLDTVSLSLEPPMEPRSGIVKRPLRRLMPLLRRGSTLCKHVAGGRPHLRFFRIEDQLGEDRSGQEAVMPHFVWYTNAPHNADLHDDQSSQSHQYEHHNNKNNNSNNKRPNEALSLPSLIGVHLLSAGDSTSDSMRRLFRRSKGVVVDHQRRSVAEGMCAVFRFEQRDVAVSFLTEADRQLWVGGMMGVVERNRELATQL
ncbi:uncharacterized protein TM35_000271490 [Trypanosoma theileri]|uniref:PH-like domain-containing protein n=1 Tax=Trypanosoma theileri TaxID=67003 RepID=A0A1X0NQW5_9TRYP|nr:uncharacterized protein TM35_000271490 [Trypanosoma theileri]ORC86559.1 hypothetical protein TM35_000271490 [Trypanosoma theileri]